MSTLSSCLFRGCRRNIIKGCQSIQYSMHKGAYEGDGKTTVTILNRDADYGLMVDAITPLGFRLNVGIYALGPMIMFPRSVIGWNIESSNEITEDSLALFKVLMPRPDIIILGLDQDYPRDAPFIGDFQKAMENLQINTEILPVVKACTTFNFLNAERRFVVGAFLPPRNINSVNETRLHNRSIQKALVDPTKD